MICLKTIEREIHHGGEVLQRMGCLSSYKLPDLKDSPNQYFQSHILGNSRIPVSLCFITDYCSYFFDQSMTIDRFSYPYAIKLQNKKTTKFTKELAPQILTGAHLQVPARHLLQYTQICPAYLLLFPTGNHSQQNYTQHDTHIWYTLLFHLGFPQAV